MPSLANIFCHGVPSGLTLTGELYPDGSDTAAGTGLTVTEQTNRKATYVLNAGVSGLHLIKLKSGSNVVWDGWTPDNLAITGDFEACATRREALNLDAKISDVPAAVDAELSGTHGNGSWEGGGGGGLGSGARTVTITVNDGAAALETARVRMIKGAENYVGSTNASGQIVFSLDDGTWSVAISLAGYTFTPTTLVVDGAESQTYSMTAVTITPSDPGQTTGYVTIRDSAGEPVDGAVVQVEIIEFSNGSTGSGIDNPRATGETDSDGFVEFVNLPRLARYRARVMRGNKSGEWSEGVTADAATTPLAGVLGLAETEA